MRKWNFIFLAFLAFVTVALTPSASVSGLFAENDFIVYGIYNSVYMGDPGEVRYRDYYINMGQKQGLNKGAIVTVKRRQPTYDLLSKTLHKDMNFTIAKLKVIHVESNVSVARLVEMAPKEETPALHPDGIVIGDVVQLGN